MELVQLLFTDYTLRTVALGAAVLGIVSGALGTFAVLRGQSLLGDAVSHAALPGIALAFLFTGMKSPLVLMIGAAVAGILGTAFVIATVRYSRVKFDSALGLTLSVFFGFGLLLLTYIQRLPSANQAGLDSYLFGQAAALVTRDVVTMGILGGIVLLLVVVFWKEFKLLAFDPEFGRTAGFPMSALDLALTALMVIAIVIGLQTVGVILMSAMLIAPAAAARQWTDRLSTMMLLAAMFGAVSGVAGAVISSTDAGLPTGPTIVLCVSGIVVVSLAFAPNRGLLFRRIRERRQGRRLRAEGVLLDLLELAEQHANPEHPHDEATLQTMSGQPSILFALEQLEERGHIRRTGPSEWALTADGATKARAIASSLAPNARKSSRSIDTENDEERP